MRNQKTSPDRMSPAALRHWRLSQGLSGEQAAELFDIAVPTYWHWERGERRVSAAVTARLEGWETRPLPLLVPGPQALRRARYHLGCLHGSPQWQYVAHCGAWHTIEKVPMECPVCKKVLFCA